MTDKLIEVVAVTTGEVVHKIGPVSEARVDKVAGGLERKLNQDFYTRIVDATMYKGKALKGQKPERRGK